MEPVRKRRKSYHGPGHYHEVTFSCYRRQNGIQELNAGPEILHAVEQAGTKLGFKLLAYVLMLHHG